MCTAVLDPANVRGWKEGKFDMRGAIDPGGKLVRKYTGSDIAQRAADPINILPEDPQDFKQQQAQVQRSVVSNPPKKRAAVSSVPKQNTLRTSAQQRNLLTGNIKLDERKALTGLF